MAAGGQGRRVAHLLWGSDSSQYYTRVKREKVREKQWGNEAVMRIEKKQVEP